MEQFEGEPKENRALIPFSDNLPYDRNRVIQETKMCLAFEIMCRFEVGKRLLLLREHEGVPTLAHILEENFSGLSRRNAYRYMLFAKKAADLPKFQAWADGRGNFSKALALMEACEEEDLAALEEGGDILGLKLDEIERMSVKQLQNALRREREKREEEIKCATEATAAENVKLKEENRSLKAALDETGIEACRKFFKIADKHIIEALDALRKVDFTLLAQDEAGRIEMLMTIDKANRVAGWLELELDKADHPDA